MMMTNLFSIFDPSLSLFSISWGMGVGVLILMPSFFWLGGSLYSFVMGLFSFMVKKEIDYVLTNPFKGCYSFLGSIFITIFLYNFLALFPHLFSFTSHMLVTLPFSYSFWGSVLIFSWVLSLKNYLAHYIPVGTPFGLISFMVLVEVVSHLIRPFALTFRLTANMVAGHLLMSMIGGAMISLPFSFMVLGSLLQFFLVGLEMGVSLIQSYVFFALLLCYISESDQH